MPKDRAQDPEGTQDLGFYVVDSPSGSKAVPTGLRWAVGKPRGAGAKAR